MPYAISDHQKRQRPIQGGVSIAALGTSVVGTLGCFLRRVVDEEEQLLALSCSHVIADFGRLPTGTRIAQPGPLPEDASANPNDAFAELIDSTRIRFNALNVLDAAIALVRDASEIKKGSLLGISTYDPTVALATQGMSVIKSSMLTGARRRGKIVDVSANGVEVSYQTLTGKCVATFNDVITITTSISQPFSRSGDSGSVILDAISRRPVGLLISTDVKKGLSYACHFGAVCEHFRALPL